MEKTLSESLDDAEELAGSALARSNPRGGEMSQTGSELARAVLELADILRGLCEVEGLRDSYFIPADDDG
jgi:hypothetical protein